MTSTQSLLIALVGPTAAGKTETALAVAEEIGASILSADSMQVYRGMDIGTAKPSREERDRVPHYLIDVADPKEFFSVADFLELATPVIEDCLARGVPLIVCGGTGLYFKALFEGLAAGPPPDEEFRAEMDRIAESKGSAYLHGLLDRVDPESAGSIHPNDRKRIVRALEIQRATGSTKKEIQSLQEGPAFASKAKWFGVRPGWAKLDERIDARVERMFEEGLVEEVRELVRAGCSREQTSMQALGYKETLDYLSGATTLEETKKTVQKKTRRFARRQMTWFRNLPGVDWRDPFSESNDSASDPRWVLEALG